MQSAPMTRDMLLLTRICFLRLSGVRTKRTELLFKDDTAICVMSFEPVNSAAKCKLTDENETSDAAESGGKFDEDSLIDSIPSDIPDLIEEDNEFDEDQEVSDTGSDQFLDPWTYTPSPNEDNSDGDRRYPEQERRPVQSYGQSSNAAREAQPTEPKSISEALNRPDSKDWNAAMMKEINSLYENKTWTAVQEPNNATVMDTKFVLKKKYDSEGNHERHKERLVVKDFQRCEFSDVYAPVIDFTNLRVLLAGAINRGGIVHHLDVKTAFLNGKLDEDEHVYVRPPPGMNLGLDYDHVLKLSRALYGLMRAPRI